MNRVLRREGAALLGEVDLATRQVLRRKVKRYEHDAPGDLIHVGVEKLGKIPHSGGHRIHARQAGRVNSRVAYAAAKRTFLTELREAFEKPNLGYRLPREDPRGHRCCDLC